jgi:peroxiredoxin
VRSLLLSVVAVLSCSLLVPTAHAGAAADFSLRDINGQSYTLAQQKGKVVLLNFRATWCGPCQVEMPHLQAMYTELAAQGLVIYGISTDDAKLDAAVKPLVKSKGLTYTVLRDPTTTVVAQFNPAKTLPYNVLVDRSGAVAKVHSGYNPGDEVTLKAEIIELLAK